MRLRSTEPGVQFYTAGDLSADVIGKGGVPYVEYAGFALETQKFPCSPNFSHFPTTELRPGQPIATRSSSISPPTPYEGAP